LLAKIKQLKEFINSNNIITFLSGAGLSTAAGLPDFRSDKEGFWEKNKPVKFSEFLKNEEFQNKSWNNNIAIINSIKRKKRTKMHDFIDKFLLESKKNTHITQNIDGFHYSKRLSSQIFELHGSVRSAHCLNCKTVYDPDSFFKNHVQSTGSCLCPNCKAGLVKVSTISFGQKLDEEILRKSFLAASRCDVLICMGTSLMVSPANSIPKISRKSNSKVVILNKEATPFDDEADLVINGDLENIYEKSK
jgi:NAD-dependent protein deacetylases, SIR2 family